MSPFGKYTHTVIGYLTAVLIALETVGSTNHWVQVATAVIAALLVHWTPNTESGGSNDPSSQS